MAERRQDKYMHQEDYPIHDRDVFDTLSEFYMEMLLNLAVKHQVELKPCNLEFETGIAVEGKKTDVIKTIDEIAEVVRQIRIDNTRVPNPDYFLTQDGQEKLKQLEQSYSVKLRMENEGDQDVHGDENNKELSGRSQISIDPSYRWKFPAGQQLVLTYGKGIETGADVVTQNFETDKLLETNDFKTEKTLGSLIVQFPVPSRRREDLYSNISKLLQDFSPRYKSIAIEVDVCKSWKIQHICKAVVTRFVKHIQSGHCPRSFKLYLCVTDEENTHNALKWCNTVLDDLNQSFKFQQINKQLRARRSRRVVKVEVLPGDITNIQADVIVNTVSPDLNLSKGAASRALSNAAGAGLQQELNKMYEASGMLYFGELAVTHGYNLPCDFVLHGFLERYKEKACSGIKTETQFYSDSVHDFLMNCFKKSTTLASDVDIISFPVIGTGALYYPTYIVAEQMFRTIEDLDPELRPEVVKIVVYHTDEHALKIFQEELTKYELRQNKCSAKRQASRRASSLLKIVGTDENIKAAKKEVFHLIQATEEDEPQFRCGQKLTLDSQNGKESAKSQSFKGKSASRSRQNLQSSRKSGSSSSVQSQDTPPTSPIADTGHEQKHNYGAKLSIVDKTDNGMKGSVRSGGGHMGLTSTQLQYGGGGGGGKVMAVFDAESHATEILQIKQEEFDLLEYFHSDFMNKYKKMGCLLEYSEKTSSIEVHGDIPRTLSINSINLDVRNAMTKIQDLQSQTVDITDMDMKTVKMHTKDLITKDVFIIESRDQVTIYSESYEKVNQTVHQLRVKLGKVQTKSRPDERQLASRSTYLDPVNQVNRKVRQNQQTEIYEHSISSRADTSLLGAIPKTTVQREFSWVADSKHLEVFHVEQKITVRVYQGSILHAPVECIVNAANKNLHHGGGVARVISEAAGRDLDREGRDFIRNHGNIRVGNVCVTTAGRLKYDCVIHAVGPNWTDYKPFSKADVKLCERDLYYAIYNSLVEAERRQLKSIAFPGISAGIYACPWDLCFVQYTHAILEYSKKGSQISLEEIHFVDTNEDLVKHVQYTFKAMINENRLPNTYDIDAIVAKAQRSYSGKKQYRGKDAYDTPRSKHQNTTQVPNDRKQPVPAKSDKKGAKIDTGGCFPYISRKPPPGLSTQEFVCVVSAKQRLFVYSGAITENLNQIDMLVCGEQVKGLGAGKVAEHIEKWCGGDFKNKKKEKFKDAKEGDIITVFHKPKSLYVAHVIMYQKQARLPEDVRRQKIVGTYKRIFTDAKKRNCKGLVMPLIGSGKGGVPVDEATRRLCEGLRQFSNSNPDYEITVHLVNFNPEKTKQSIDTIEKLVAILNKATPVPPNSSSLRSNAGASAKPESSRNQQEVKRNASSVPKSGSFTRNTDTNSTQEKFRQNQHQIRRNASPHAPPKDHHQKHNGGDRHPKQNGGYRQSGPIVTQEFHMSAQSGQGTDDHDDILDTEQRRLSHHDQGAYNREDYEPDDSQDEYESSDNIDHEIGAPADHNEETPDDCVICMEKLNRPKRLPCGHSFCSDCIEQQFVYKEACPVCGRVCGTITGDQPEGSMKIHTSRSQHCAGYEKYGRIDITYHFPDGKQGQDHPSPGKWYKGFTRVAYLPDNKQGRQICDMLKVAFDRKLVFTIGNSRTTGQEGVITWNDIHHKTDPKPHTQFGYPDPGYLDRVTDELAAKGVTKDDL